jgi:SAM-dependent methyltransferase
VPRRIDHHGRGPQEIVIYERVRGLLPAPLRRYVIHFEAQVERAVAEFARSLPAGARVLDAGAGEVQYKHLFSGQRYCGVDLAVGDVAWDYSRLDAMANLCELPFRDRTFDACINIVTLEHIPEPAKAIAEMARTLAPGGRLLLIAPHEWEVHQEPHDYFRYTKYGLRYLTEKAGLEVAAIEPVGGFFRMLSRRMFNAAHVVPFPLDLAAMLLFWPAALIMPLADGLDKKRNFTLGYICIARKPS